MTPRLLTPRPLFRIGVAALITALVTILAYAPLASAASSCPNGATMSVVAHEDDSFLFQSPDLLHDIQNGRCVRTVFITAGDAGLDSSYWSSREQGAEAAYASMAGVPSTWTQSDAGIAGHPMPLMTLSGNPNVSIVFMRLPDGSPAGGGFAATGYQSLRQLWMGSIPKMTAVDGSSSYTELDLINTLTALMKSFAPDRVDTQDWVGTYDDGDHTDHHSAAYLAQQASRAYNTVTHTLVGYMGYPISNKPANVSGADLTAKSNAFYAYGKFDSGACSSQTQCQNSNYSTWLARQYTTATETDGPGIGYPPLAIAKQNNSQAAYGSTVTLNGSGSFDPNGGTTNYQWTQTAGPAVALSSSTAASPTFTAPTSNATLTFQLVVSDGLQVSQPATVTIIVTPPDLALQATATASGEDLSDDEGAAKAIDGVVDGSPGDSTKEWSVVGGGAGSWLKLTWPGSITTNQIVLYDRPNLADQITSGTLTFSDGTTVPVGALNNDGSATVVNFPTKTTTSVQLTVNSVASSTQNVGLAEIMVFTPATGSPPSASAGANQTVTPGSSVTLDGSGSFDPNGNPNYLWTQTGGPAVTLSSNTAVQPVFVAPSTPTTLTFQLVVSDGRLTSQPATVAVTVATPATDLAPLATATASSENASTSQTADKAIDGVIDGYPGDYTKEWATLGGGAGSWLNLAWTAPQTINKVVLYDRPNLADQITGATLTFSGGTIVQVPALNNDGSATTVTFPAVTTTSLLMTVTSVSASTQNVGLAEIQAYGPAVVNTQPTVASTSPNGLAVGAANQNVTITGTNFNNGPPLAASFGAGVTVNSTTYVSATQLTANVSIPAGTTTGARDVTVTNGDGTTATGTGAFTVNPDPTVSLISPSALGQGASNQNVTITGTGFEPGASASFGAGATVNSTTFVSATQLTANVTVGSAATLGAYDVTVTNPDTGVGSASGGFTVNAAPTVASANPGSADAGTANLNVTLTGAAFVSGSSVNFSNPGITVNSTTYGSPTQLTANITIAGTAAPGAGNVTVSNPDGGSGSGTGAFTVNPIPTVTSTSPGSGDQGATNYNVTINGTKFATGASASFAAAGITVNSTTYVSATQLTANISISGSTPTGGTTVTVTNPDGSTATGTNVFQVNSAPAVTSARPGSGQLGATAMNVTITGTGFDNGPALAVSFGAGITVNSVTYVGQAQLTANVTIATTASAGARDVTVTNGDGSTATGSGAFTVTTGPTVTSANPGSADAGAANLNVTITGTAFASGAKASFGTGVTVNSTTFVSGTQLTANISIPAGTATGARTVTVTNPDGTNGAGVGAFTVNGAPTVTSASPNVADVGATNYNVTITGTNLESGATASFGTGVTVNSTTFVSATQLTANITIPTGTATGARTVTVTNSDGTTATRASAFTVRAAPTVTSASPNGADVGATNYNVTITGTGFESGATASFGTGVMVTSTTFVSATQLTASITIPTGTATGATTMTVANPDGTTATSTSTFTVRAAPTVTSTTPAAADLGTTNYNVTITGTSFESGAKASFGTGVTVNSTTFVSATSLRANITIPATSTSGAYNVTVNNPDGSAATNAGLFTVNGAPTVAAASPSVADVGATSYKVTITGTGFESGAKASFGTGVTVNSTTFVSATQLTANITIPSTSATGAYNVTVNNPDGSAATNAGAFTVNGAPTITFPTATGQEKIASSTTASFSITGTNFETGAKVTISGGFGTPTVTFVSPTQLNVTVRANATKGTYNLTVTNPDATTVVSTGAMVNQ